MKTIKQYVIDTLKGDSTLQGYLGASGSTRVFPDGVDITPETFPMVTIFDVTEMTHTSPKTDREGVLQIDVWSNKSALEIDNIYERILTLLNFAQFRTGYSNAILRWGREEMAADQNDTDRRLWHKVVRWRWWAKP